MQQCHREKVLRKVIRSAETSSYCLELESHHPLHSSRLRFLERHLREGNVDDSDMETTNALYESVTQGAQYLKEADRCHKNVAICISRLTSNRMPCGNRSDTIHHPETPVIPQANPCSMGISNMHDIN